MTEVCWAEVCVDDRCFVFSPRFGCTYLFARERLASGALRFLLGLRAANRRPSIEDPATSVRLVGAFEKPLLTLKGDADANAGVDVGRRLPRLYGFFHRHRTVASIGRVVAAARLAARFQGIKQRATSLSEIGEAVMMVERKLGLSDCYPRALLTAFLCIRAGLRCQVVVGIMAPTSNLHAWCVSDGIVPYEPVRRHWWYEPLAVFDVS